MARVGLVGFFGWGNYGDELFLRLWQRRLGAFYDVGSVVEICDPPYFNRSAVDVADEYDALVIGGGDLVIPTTISPLYWNSAWLRKSVYISGVGVPTWVGAGRQDVVERMARFFQHENVRYISARDSESAEWIRRHLTPRVPVYVHADLVFALPAPPARAYERPTLGVAVRYQRKGGADLSHIESVVRKIAADGFDVARIVLGVGATGQRDLEIAQALDVPGAVIHSEDLDEITAAIGGLYALMSQKFHGTVVATMYGVPTIVLSSTSKSRNLFGHIDRPRLLSSPSDADMYDKFTLCGLPVPRIVREELTTDAETGVRALVEHINRDSPEWR